MDRFISNLPKNILAAAAIIGGIFVIVTMNPPHTLCDSQLDSFKNAQMNFIYLDPKDKIKKTTNFELDMYRCKTSNSPGGCYELFFRLKTLLKDLDSVPPECSGQAGGDTKIRQTLWDSLDLLTRLAWGQKPPEVYHNKLNWLEPPDVLLYCRLKRAAERLYGNSNWEQFREKMFKNLPGIDKLDRATGWEMMLLSTNCEAYR
ncbi:MAG: hypothetical protein IPJ71_13200 [Bdellovibrionales bacterium]|nr:hypothetical protein [Bdellovibrionales bacterium]